MKRTFWWLWLGLTVTCASPRPLPPAHAEVRSKQPSAPAKAKASVGSGAAPEPGGAVPESGVAGPLAAFFQALRELKQGQRQRHVRIFWLGDSHTNADFLSGAVRDALSGVFGDGGPGFVRVGTKLYRHDGVKLGRGGKWNVDPDPPARREVQGDGVFGLGGTRAVPGADASFSLQVKARDADASARFEVAYALPTGSSFDLALGKHKLRVDAKVSADVAPSGIAHLSLTAPLGTPLELGVGQGEPRLFNVVVERAGPPGIVLDTVGIDGARLETPLAWSEPAFVAELSRRSPELVVVAFGTNEVFDALRVDRYGQHLARLIGRIRLAVPGASCLVLGPTDAPLDDGSRPRVAEVTAVLAQSAAALGCSFVSLQALMGGEGSFARGMKVKERLAQPDRIHLTPRGYQVLGAALGRELLDAYLAGGAALP